VIRPVALVVAALLAAPAVQTRYTTPVRGLTAAPHVARAYDTILNADFAAVRDRLQGACGPAPPEVCRMLQALALWWEISLEPESRSRDGEFSRIVEEAIAAAEAWTRREPERAEAWFYVGAAYGARVQWRVLRQQRLAAARDGKRIKEALERALALDPALHDANFGVGLYRYYADVAPVAVRMVRWLLLLPGGNRKEGLRQIIDARDRGQLVRGEADYQLHLIYLWYEKRPHDALTLVRNLQARYPNNPLFHYIEAEIHDVYFHDPAASLATSGRLLRLANETRVNEPSLASVRARLNMAVQLERLKEYQRALEVLDTLIAERPTRPHGAIARAQTLRRTIESARP